MRKIIDRIFENSFWQSSAKTCLEQFFGELLKRMSFILGFHRNKLHMSEANFASLPKLLSTIPQEQFWNNFFKGWGKFVIFFWVRTEKVWISSGKQLEGFPKLQSVCWANFLTQNILEKISKWYFFRLRKKSFRTSSKNVFGRWAKNNWQRRQIFFCVYRSFSGEKFSKSFTL